MPLWTDLGHGFKKVPAARADNRNVAFLCCPGPSLAEVEDLRGVGRTVYGVNTSYPKAKPDVWVGLDRMACFNAGLWQESFPKITRYFKDDNARVRYFPNVFYADLEEAAATEIFIRRDNESKFVWQKNTLVFALHYLIWLGHKRIHFIGCDMGGERDYWDDRQLAPEQHASNRRLYRSQVETLRTLTPLAARNGIHFINSTPDSPLNQIMPFQLISDMVVDLEARVKRIPVVHVSEADRAALTPPTP